MELTDLTIYEASAEIAARRLSPVDLTRACLERIDRYNPSLNCFITLTAESALQQAAWAEQEIQGGGWRGPLHGIPLALKDLYETSGVRTTAGSRVFADYVPETDAFTVQKLKSAGAILLGKLNMHEIALGVTNDNPHFGACINPWDGSRITGGSSGGSGAAVAAGLCLGSLGSDTGGSIRIPASLCGVVGLKPTFGRVSLRGVIPLSWNLDHAGPLARRVRDAAILLQVVAGYDPEDAVSQDAPVDDYLAGLEDGVRGWKVALAAGEYLVKTDDEVLKAVQAAARLFETLGASVTEVEIPGLLEAAQANSLMVTSDAAAFHRERLRLRPQDFGPDVLQRLQGGAAYSSTEYVLARRTQSVLRRKFETFFKEYDILLMPTTPIPAPTRQGDDAVRRAQMLTPFTAPFNLTGLPALTLPCGFSAQGLPLGLQIAAGPWKEAAVLRAGRAYEQATEWHQHKPGLQK
jgi:aspartyl-tRNA(Asn)/glutamyl-tRNA(Gln) amidotransferase subunit A